MSYNDLIIETDPAAQDVRFLRQRLEEFNAARTGVDDDGLLACFARDEGGIVAGIYGWTWGGGCEIKHLWVREDLRGQGLGGRLLAAAERKASARGCLQVLLDTHSFQAPDFYQHRGYGVIAIVEDYPLGHKKFYLRKVLRPVKS